MSVTYVAEGLRQTVKKWANWKCEYCPTHEDDVLFPHHIEADMVTLAGGGFALADLLP